MKSRERKVTTMRMLNKLFRVPQRVQHNRLSTGAMVIVETYKNKKIVKVCAEVNSRYLQKI